MRSARFAIEPLLLAERDRMWAWRTKVPLSVTVLVWQTDSVDSVASSSRQVHEIRAEDARLRGEAHEGCPRLGGWHLVRRASLQNRARRLLVRPDSPRILHPCQHPSLREARLLRPHALICHSAHRAQWQLLLVFAIRLRSNENFSANLSLRERVLILSEFSWNRFVNCLFYLSSCAIRISSCCYPSISLYSDSMSLFAFKVGVNCSILNSGL